MKRLLILLSIYCMSFQLFSATVLTTQLSQEEYKCKKCKDSGIIQIWEKCPNPKCRIGKIWIYSTINGKRTITSTNCLNCINSKKPGQILKQTMRCYECMAWIKNCPSNMNNITVISPSAKTNIIKDTSVKYSSVYCGWDKPIPNFTRNGGLEYVYRPVFVPSWVLGCNPKPVPPKLPKANSITRRIYEERYNRQCAEYEKRFEAWKKIMLKHEVIR